MKRLVVIVGILLLLLALFAEVYRLLVRQPVPSSPMTLSYKPKIIYVPRVDYDTIYIPTEKEYVPVVKKIYLPDTARRQRMERDTLVAGVKLVGNRLQIDRISTRGVVVKEDFVLPESPLSEGSVLLIDAQGNTLLEQDPKELKRAKRRKFWRKVGNTAADVAKVGIGILAGVAIF